MALLATSIPRLFFEVDSYRQIAQPQHHGFSFNAPPLPQAHGSSSAIDHPPFPRNSKGLHNGYKRILLVSTSSTSPSCNTSKAKTLPNNPHTFEEPSSLHLGETRREYEAYESEEDRRGRERAEE